MKNYLVKSLFRVTNPNWQVVDRSHEINMHSNYQQMHDISVLSHTANLKGEWEYCFLDGEVTNINDAFVKTFWFIHDLWRREPCNILYTDPDTVVVKPLDIWNKFDKFMMFNYTDPKSYSGNNHWQRQFPHFFNAGVRFFPATMSKDTWEQGATMARQWDHTTYDTEQIILNAMLWDQGITLEQALHPEIAYQAQWLPMVPLETQDAWNNCSIYDSSIVHVHGSRNSEVKLNFLKQLVGIK